MEEKETKIKLMEIANIDVQSKLGVITDNLPTIKKQIEIALKPYMGKEVSIDNLQDAKKSRAELNKIFNIADKKRRSIKKDWNTPYKKWEEQFADSISFLTDCIADLDVKIKITEKKVLDDKIEKIETAINERLALESDNTAMFIREISWFRNPKWENKSETLTKIKKEIDAIIDKINQDINLIARDEDFYTPMLEEYKKHGQLGDALTLKDRLVIERERREQLRLEQEAKREERRKELERAEEEKKRLTEKNRLENSNIVFNNMADITHNVQIATNTLFNMENEDDVTTEQEVSEQEEEKEEESKSVPLDNSNWQETEYANRIEKVIEEPIIKEPVRPELIYGCAKDYIKISIGYEFRTDVATARYLKELGIFLGAEVIRTASPTAIKGVK